MGIHWAAEQVRDLLDHQVKGIHFYTLNRSSQIFQICQAIGLETFGEVL
jgi:methylenetetrahydrofolate reductase (NADPH)